MTTDCDKSDSHLLREYSQSGSQAALAALVQRHTGLVHASARRQLCARGCGDQLADDVTQAVFLVMFRKASQIPASVPLSSWLLTVTRYAVNNAVKAQRRRQQHENTAAAMNNELPGTPSSSEFEPLLDEALAQLNPKDRHAILLRFAENRTMDEIGHAMGVSGDAARVRINRAVEKLRSFFARQGVTAGNAMIVASLQQSLVHSAPSALSRSVISALTQSTPSSAARAIADSTIKTMLHAKLKVGLAVTAVVLTAIGVGAWQVTAQPQLAATSPVAPALPRQATTDQAQAIVHTLSQLREALRADDRPAIDRLIVVPAGVRGQFMRVLMYEDAASTHLDRAWQHRFAGVLTFQSVGFHPFSAIHANMNAIFDPVLELAKPSDVTITGATARLRIDLTQSYPPGEAQRVFGPWATPSFGFVQTDGQWKLDVAATMNVGFSLRFLPGHSAGQQNKTEEEVEVAFTQSIIAALDEAAARIEQGDFSSPQAARSWTRTQVGNAFDRHFLESSGYSATPVK